MIDISGLKKSFGDKVIFKDLSIKINDGEFIVFTGKSGCGKTTLLNMIGGIEKIDCGNITVNGLDITNKKHLRRYYQKYVGFLFQNFALIEKKTIEENLNILRKNVRSSMTMEQVLDKVGLKGREKQKVFTLSGGEQQRVALARLMMKQCDLILADEPTGSLDHENAVQVMEILRALNKMGKTVIMVTHDTSLIDDTMKTIKIS